MAVADKCSLADEDQYQSILKKALEECAGVKFETEAMRKARAEQFLSWAKDYAEKGDQANCEANLQKALDERGNIGPKVEKARAEMYLALASKWTRKKLRVKCSTMSVLFQKKKLFQRNFPEDKDKESQLQEHL